MVRDLLEVTTAGRLLDFVNRRSPLRYRLGEDVADDMKVCVALIRQIRYIEREAVRPVPQDLLLTTTSSRGARRVSSIRRSAVICWKCAAAARSAGEAETSHQLVLIVAAEAAAATNLGWKIDQVCHLLRFARILKFRLQLPSRPCVRGGGTLLRIRLVLLFLDCLQSEQSVLQPLPEASSPGTRHCVCVALALVA
jgi:hypothetical protein